MSLIDFIFPKACVSCGKNGDYLCNKCLGELHRINCFCPYCGEYSYKGKTHISCRHRLGLDGLIIGWKYEGNIRKLILKLKYNFSYDIAEFLAKNFDTELKERTEFFKRAIFIPVPLHLKRERWRGFNQANEVCKKLCEKNGWRMEELLVRKKATKTQAQLKGKERRQNVKDVFAINLEMISRNGSDVFYCSSSRVALRASNQKNPRRVSGTSTAQSAASRFALATTKIPSITTSVLNKNNFDKIIIFDDVWTSGSTIRECCKVLKKAGAKEVWGMSIAG